MFHDVVIYDMAPGQHSGRSIRLPRWGHGLESHISHRYHIVLSFVSNNDGHPLDLYKIILFFSFASLGQNLLKKFNFTISDSSSSGDIHQPKYLSIFLDIPREKTRLMIQLVFITVTVIKNNYIWAGGTEKWKQM